MGSSNNKLKSKHSVVGKWKAAPYEIKIHGVNPQEEDTGQFSLTEIEFSLVPDRDRDTVCLRGLMFFFKLTCTCEGSAFQICSLSNESYLVSDYDNKSVVKLDASSGDITSLRTPGCPDALCSLDKNRAAVSIENRRHDNLSEIHILDTNRGLEKISTFSVREKCSGMAYLDDKLYIGNRKDISVYSTEGRHLNTIFRQNTRISIEHLAEGPDGRLICVTSADKENLAYNIVERDGSILDVVWTKFGLNFLLLSLLKLCLNTAIDPHGNVYVHDDFEYDTPVMCRIVKITRERRIKVQPYPFDVSAMCFDESLDMLALMSDKKFVLGSPI